MSDGRGLAGLRAEIERYYSHKLQIHGPTPRGVDWSCLPTQEMRFVQLLKLCDFSAPFTLNDIGCGYGALLSFLGKKHRASGVDYLGIDLSPAMIEAATHGWRRQRRGKFAVGHAVPRTADYCVASGIFNVKQSQPKRAWEEFIEHTIEDMHSRSRIGFAMNFLDSRYVVDHVPELYSTTPGWWSKKCRDSFDVQVEVLSSYGMHEFTLLVRRLAGPRPQPT